VASTRACLGSCPCICHPLLLFRVHLVCAVPACPDVVLCRQSRLAWYAMRRRGFFKRRTYLLAPDIMRGLSVLRDAWCFVL